MYTWLKNSDFGHTYDDFDKHIFVVNKSFSILLTGTQKGHLKLDTSHPVCINRDANWVLKSEFETSSKISKFTGPFKVCQNQMLLIRFGLIFGLGDHLLTPAHSDQGGPQESNSLRLAKFDFVLYFINFQCDYTIQTLVF